VPVSLRPCPAEWSRNSILTEKVNGLLIGAKSVGGDAIVSPVVIGVDVDDTQTERQLVIAVVVRLNAVLARTDDAMSVFLPVIDGVWIGCYATLENSLAAAHLRDSSVWHRYFR